MGGALPSFIHLTFTQRWLCRYSQVQISPLSIQGGPNAGESPCEAGGIKLLQGADSEEKTVKGKDLFLQPELKGPTQVSAGEPVEGSRVAISRRPTLGKLCLEPLGKDPFSPASTIY